MELSVVVSPAEIAGLPAQDLSKNTCVVFAVLRATSTMLAALKAEHVLIGSFANLTAPATWLTQASPSRVLLVCSGTGDDPCLEDALAVGALIDRLRGSTAPLVLADSAILADLSFQQAKPRLKDVFCEASNARRLLAMPDLAADGAWCLVLDQCPFVAGLGADGIIRVPS